MTYPLNHYQLQLFKISLQLCCHPTAITMSKQSVCVDQNLSSMQIGILNIHNLRMGIYPLITYFSKLVHLQPKLVKSWYSHVKFCCLALGLENLQRVLQSRQSKKGPSISHPLHIILRWFPFPATSLYIFYETNIHKLYLQK